MTREELKTAVQSQEKLSSLALKALKRKGIGDVAEVLHVMPAGDKVRVYYATVPGSFVGNGIYEHEWRSFTVEELLGAEG